MFTVGSFRVRRRVESDLPALVEGLALVAEADGYPSVWPRDPAAWLRTAAPIGAWVAESEGVSVGQVVLRLAEDDPPADLWCAATGRSANECAVVKRFFVIPAARGAGAGRALLAAACQAAAEWRLRPVLDVTERNLSAVRLYERLGWIRLGSFEATFRDDHPAETLHCFAGP